MRNRLIWPNLVTFSNLFVGFFSVTLIAQDRFLLASWLLVVASILDGLDGLVARLMRQSSRFGGEMDSFSDVISFGLAPGFLVYRTTLAPLGVWGLLLGFLPVAAGAARLARFNLIHDTTPRGWFIGLPIPTMALMLVGYFLYAHKVTSELPEPAIYISLILMLSFLMVSPIPYRRMPVVPIRNNRYAWLSVIILVVSGGMMLWKPALTLFPLMLVYLATGPVEWAVRLIKKASLDISEEDEEEMTEEAIPDEKLVPENKVLPPRRSADL